MGDLGAFRLAVMGLFVVLSASGNVTSTGGGQLEAMCSAPYTELVKKLASDGSNGDRFGYSVAISGDTAIVGAYTDATPGGSSAGSAYVFTRSNGVWTEQQKLTASDGAAFDNFGFSVGMSGETAIVGAYQDDTMAGQDAGSAYVFTRNGGVWTQQQKLTAPDGAGADRFGTSVALSGDSAIVGAPLTDPPGGNGAGSAYVFRRSGVVWTHQQKLAASDVTSGDTFGTSVAIDGDTAIAGSIEGSLPGRRNGSAYVFTRSGAVWTQQQKLAASDGASFDNFGISVAISADTAIVGADRDDTPGGSDAGSAYVFTRAGALWTQQQKLTASDGDAGDDFGISVAVSGDTALVGAYLDEAPGGANAGSAYAYTRSGDVWTQQQPKLTASDRASGDFFGYSVAVSGDTTIIGAYSKTTSAPLAGAAYFFNRNCGGTISGTVFYGTTPVGQPTKFVPGVLLTGSGSVPVNASTNSSGAYLLSGLDGGAYTVTPTKSGDVNGISALDASRVAQHAAGLIVLTSNQILAGDATNNGTLSALDASRIAQFAAGIPNPGIAGQWKFVPVSKSYPSVPGSLSNENYEAILVGDVSGNWTSPAAVGTINDRETEISDRNHPSIIDGSVWNRNGRKPPGAIQIDLPATAMTEAGTVLTLPVPIGETTEKGILAYEFTLDFDPTVLKPTLDTASFAETLSNGWSVTVNAEIPGRIAIAAYSTQELTGAGTLLNLSFNVIGNEDSETALSWRSFQLNESDMR